MRPSLLLVTAAGFYPAYQGDAARVAAFVRFFRARGWRVSIVHFHDVTQACVDYAGMAERCDELVVHHPTPEELARRAQGVMDDWCPEAFRAKVDRVAARAQPDVVLAQFVFLSAALELPGIPPGALRVLDADNVMSARADLYRAACMPYDWVQATREEERRGLLRADLVLGIQERECEALRALAPEVPVLLTPHAHAPVAFAPARERSIVFVGAMNAENASGLVRFVAEAWPRIRARHPDVVLHVAGGVSAAVGAAPGVELHGVVPDVSALYRRAALALNPVCVGTGLKIKTVEALMYGKCLVATSAGVQGLEAYPHAYVRAETPSEMAHAIAHLFDDDERWKAMSRRAHAFAARYFAEDAVLGRLEEAFHASSSEARSFGSSPRSSVMASSQTAGSDGGPARMCARNSTEPRPPRMGETMRPTTLSDAEPSAATTRWSASRRRSTSRMPS